ncbi:MAG: two-component system response regulator [Sedimenticola sp.]|nr:MAG: two-component system response regulator [Sedimenticola sp.]
MKKENSPSPTHPVSGNAGTRLSRIVILYAFLSVLWILFSDALVGLIFHDPATITIVSALKGWFFVGVTSLLLYFLLKRLIEEITEGYRREGKMHAEQLHTLAMLESITSNTTDAIFVKDRQGRYLTSNRALSDLLGKTPDEMIGRDDFALFPKALAEQFQADDQKIIAQGKTLTYEEPVIAGDKTLPYMTTKGPLIINGQIEGIFGIARDITEQYKTQKSLEDKKQQLTLLLNTIPYGIQENNVEGVITYSNSAHHRILGKAPGSLLGQPIWHAEINEQNRQKLRDYLRYLVAEQPQPEPYVTRNFRDDGREVTLEINWNYQRNDAGAVTGFISVISDITEQKHIEDQLALANVEWTLAMDQIDDVIYLLDMQRRLMRANQAFYRMVNSDPKHCIGRHIVDLIHPEGEKEACPVCQAQEAQREVVITLEPDDFNNPSDKPLELRQKLVRDNSGQATSMLVSLHDLSRARQVEETLRLAASVFENTDEGVVITDAQGKILEVNRAFTEILGYTRDEVIGRNPRLWQSLRHDESFYRNMWLSLTETGQWRGELWNRRKDGSVFPEWQTISSVTDEEGRLTHYVGVFSDISQIKHSQEQLDHLAHHDALTDLPNRLLLNERLEQAIRHAERNASKLAVIFLDLDLFKHINDSLGHPAGDSLLQKVAAKLVQTVRQGDTVARIGGDEFVLLLEEIDIADNVVVAAEKLMAIFAEPFQLGDQGIRITASLGITLYPRDGKDSASLLRNADAAMYRAKEEGRNTYQFYTEELTRNAFERVLLENNLRQAISREELRLVYQPQVDLQSGQIIGVEALIRWQHPELGIISPIKFIPLAEESGLIHSIGEWVLRTACRQGRDWLERGIDFGSIAVNVAGHQIQRGNLPEDVKKILAETRFPSSQLELEVTEGFIMQQADFAIRQLMTLRQMGVTLAIDDFGTGYSSLSYLKQLPIHKLKIDQSFVRDIPEDPNDMAIADAIIAMGKSLGLTVIAEGVETQEQANFLKAAGCQEAQGYLYSRPITADELEQILLNS